MLSVINFFSRRKQIILFIFLEIIALFLTVKAGFFDNSFISKKIIVFNGYINDKQSNIKGYFSLKKENQRLIEENTRLLNLYQGKDKKLKPEILVDSTLYQKYYYIAAKVISNSIDKPQNYILIDKGKKQGVTVDMGVIVSNGVIGQVVETTDNYSKVRSVLSVGSGISARLKSSKFFGVLKWENQGSHKMHLSIPKYVKFRKGDTIESYSVSSLYPEGIALGVIENAEPDEQSGSWDIYIRLFQDLGNIQNVYVVSNMDKLEIKKLEEDPK